jgi:RNA polymerase sigma-70 factor (ECF subfamily)
VERSDRELVRECRRGNKDAFRVLVERYQRKILSVAAGMLQNQDDALEVTQEAFVKAYRNLDGFKGESSFYTWLYRIVVNLAIDRRRRERRHGTVAIEDRPGGGEDLEADLPSQRLSDPYQQAKSRELGDRLRSAIDDLTPDQKAVILLREVEGLSYDEISQVMQCPKGTVMSRLHYARKALQEKLKDYL